MADKTYLDEIKSSHKPKRRALDEAIPASDANYSKSKATLALNVRITEQENRALLDLCQRHGWTKTQAIREAILALSTQDE